MPKKTDWREYETILECVSLFSEGATIDQIAQALPISLHPRSLRRRLAFLVQENRLIIRGSPRSRQYQIPTNEHIQEKELQKNELIPLSSLSIDIQKSVIQPIQRRKPVGYHREFLEQYRPNVTRYLSESITQHLNQLGKTDGIRPAGTYARQIFNRLLIDLSWNSSRLEGNTYSLLETERLLKLSEIVEGKDLKEAQMIINHKEAIEFLVDAATDIGINRFTILNLHALLSNDLLGDLEACGRLRSIIVNIGRSVYQPLSIPQLIAECFQQILDTANAIKNPFEQAFFLMVHLPYLQPFEDVNKRVSRLAANIPLIRCNLCPLSFVDVPQSLYISGLLGVYELNRIELLRDVFVWAYERSCLRYSTTRKELGDPDPFRIRYRSAITENVVRIVRECMSKTMAIASIRNYVQRSVPPEDRIRFIEAVEKDLMSMHEGNIARHHLRPSEYDAWQKVWK